MTDGRCVLFRKGLHDAARTFLQYLRPDGQLLRVGDDFNEDGTSYALGVVDLLAFLTGTYYQDPILKSFAKKGMEGFSSFSLANTVVSPTMFLILNDPELPCAGLEDLPLTWYNGSPLGSVIARSAWNDPNAFQVYMKIGESYSTNHEHKDAGSFQIYYKGILASDSGAYDSYFTPEDMAYNKQTISSNALLIFNPEMQDNDGWVYSGGQTIQGDANTENLTAAEWLRKRTARQARVLGHDCGAADAFRYAYLAGDLTNAYDPETVDQVTRSMLAVSTENPAAPWSLPFTTGSPPGKPGSKRPSSSTCSRNRP